MGEDHKDQVDRELKELLEELRIIVPGVQLLGGFLLAVAFQSKFDNLGVADKAIYFAAFIAAGIAGVFFLAPVSQHRLLWRRPKKETVLKTASLFTFLGGISLAASLGLVTYLIGHVVYGSIIAGAVTGPFVAFIVATWYVLPVIQMASSPEEAPAKTRPATRRAEAPPRRPASRRGEHV